MTPLLLPMLEPHRAALETCTYCPKLSRAACPVSNVEHSETVTPWGKMSLAYFAARGDVPVDAEHAAPAWACTGCYACRERCDHKNEVASALVDARAEMFAAGAAPEGARQVAARFAEREAEAARALDALPSSAGAGAAVLIGCTYARRAPEVAADALRATGALLDRPVRALRSCCGLPLLYAGDRPGFVAAARRLAAEIAGATSLVAVDPGCARALLVEYPRAGVPVPKVDLFVDLAARAQHRLRPQEGAPTYRYHDPCQLGRGLGRFDEPRAVLARIGGRAPLEFQRARRDAECSGAGGLLPATRPESSRAIADQRLAAHRAEGGGVLVTHCAQSLHRFRKNGEQAEDLASLVARALAPGSMSAEPGSAREAAPRRTVADRLLGSYLIVLVAFAVTVGWSFLALRAAARDAELLRTGYVPLLLRIGEARAEQNVFNAQLNHVTEEKIPGDVREWLKSRLPTRPQKFAQLREAAETGVAGDEIAREASAIERSLDAEPERFSRLFQALSLGDREAAERARTDLVKRATETAQRLHNLRNGVDKAVSSLTDEAQRREERSKQLLVGLGLLTLLVGLMISIYARRVLAPLSAVTARAKAVARGNLTPHQVIATNDEIGELATTFEGMVGAIQRARAELVQAERLATIGKMAAHVTHEIRNPLSAIGLNVELLEEEVARFGEKEPMALVQAVKSEVDRLSRISEQYLSVARRPAPRLERERVDDLVRELVSFIQPELDRAGVVTRLDLDADVPEVDLDESQLRQALLNLIRNAREAMPKGGELGIGVTRAGPSVELRVDDTGAGVPEDLRATIFNPFFTTKQRGTGLGLAVTREIVEAHHGTIHCEPRPKGGTRFRIVLPAPSA